MADDEAPEINEESKKDREEAEQAKALNAVTDNVSGSSSSTPVHAARTAAPDTLLALWISCAGAREAAR